MISMDEKKFYTVVVNDRSAAFTNNTLYGCISNSIGFTNNSLISPITQGTDRQTRIGNTIRVHKIEWAINMNLGTDFNAAKFPGGVSVRFLLVRNNQTNGGALAPSDIIDSTYGTPSGFVGYLNNGLTIDNRKKITVLVDRICVIPVGTSADCQLKFSIPCKDLQVRYQSTATTTSSLTKYDFQPFVIYAADKPIWTATGTPPAGPVQACHTFRVWFTDN